VRGKPILGYQLDALSRTGIHDVIIVGGYQYGQVKDYVGDRCRVICNAAYETTNSMYSLSLASTALRGGEFLLLNGDIVFDVLLLEQLTSGNGTATLVDRDAVLRDGEMNVVVRAGNVVEFSKEVPAAKADAVSLQITQFSASDSSLLFGRVDELIATGHTHLFPAGAYDAILRRSAMRAVMRRGGVWAEIDTLEDLAALEEAGPMRTVGCWHWPTVAPPSAT
jgi:phosphoenolpyruvate phosphomutase